MAGNKRPGRERRKIRVRKKVTGTAERPRLSVYRSLRHIHAQLVNDLEGKTLLGMSTAAKDFAERTHAGNVKGAKALGKALAERARAQRITKVVFDRSGCLYHGRVKAVAEGAREGGLEF